MIARSEIDTMADTVGVHPSDIQRDYVHGWLLSALYGSSSLANRLVLKGGSCLRKGYFENARYSRDLDFTTSTSVAHEELGRELNALCSILTDRTGVVFDTSRTRIEEKQRADKEKHIAEARLYFRDFYGKESEIVLGIRLDITQFDRTYLPIQSRVLIHPYSDAEACKAPIRCVKLEEILATKMRCLLQRRHIADLFDLVYATFVTHEIALDRHELLSTFFKITIFQSAPGVAKGLLIDLPLEALSRFWTTYISCPGNSRFTFEQAKEGLFSLLNTLIPEPVVRDYNPIFFPSALRNPIMEAAYSLTLLRLRYHGVERLVEPYELVFKIPRDGRAREYFYAYDTTGGRASGAGLKTFVAGDVESIANTDQSFEPRYEVAIRKAGGAETVSRFEGRRTIGAGLLTPPLRARVHPTGRRTRRSSHFSGLEYVLECSYCSRRFKRTTRNTKLNPHKDKYGNPCYGRMGFFV